MTVKVLKKKNNMPNFKKNPNPIMKKGPFKMKGYSYPGKSPIKDSKAKAEYKAMKKAPGNPGEKLTETYGGTWTKQGTTWRNQDGLTAVQVAQKKSREELAN